MITYKLLVGVSMSRWTDVPVLAAVAGLVVVLVIAGVGVALIALPARRSLQTQLAHERERHDALRLQVAALEGLELAARRLAAAESPTAIADETARAADELVDATEVILLLRAADDLTVAVGTDPAQATSEAAAQALATQVVTRRGPVRSDGDDGGDGDDGDSAGIPADSRVPRLACPLRHADGSAGVLVLARGPGDAPFSPADSRLVDRLAAHVALAVSRLQPRDGVESGVGALDQGARTVVLDLDDRSDVAPAAAAVSVDLAAVVRELTSYARTLAEDQGERRRVAVLAPAGASSELPEEAVRELIRATYELVIGGTEPGSNIAVEVLALKDGWELVVAHGGDALSTRSAAASALLELVAAVGGEVESGQGAGVARIRIRLPRTRTEGGLRSDQPRGSLAPR